VGSGALPEERGIRVAYALGALAGLRTGEILALSWSSVNLDALAPVLAAHKLKAGGEGRLFTTDRPGRRAGKNGAPSRFMRISTLHDALREALAKCGLPGELTWYQTTRHTFASHWVMSGGSMEKLAAMLGHSSTEVTKRYAHLRPDAFGDEDRAGIQMQPGQHMASNDTESNRPKRRKSRIQ
jgi:integrase